MTSLYAWYTPGLMSCSKEVLNATVWGNQGVGQVPGISSDQCTLVLLCYERHMELCCSTVLQPNCQCDSSVTAVALNLERMLCRLAKRGGPTRA